MPEEPSRRADHRVFRYRPRTEGLFARIERWVHTTTGETHWRTITKDNVTSVFGDTAAHPRSSDPNDDQRVYEWLLHETYDALGNHILCEYAADDPSLYDDDNPDLRLPEIFERRRRPTNRYLRRVYYGNLPEPLVDSQQHTVTYADGTAVGHLRGGRRYAFEVVFDYGDWPTPTVLPHPEPPADQLELFGADQPTSTTSRPVPLRADRFSHFRAGFEIRTLRRCRRVLMFHHFAELGGPDVGPLHRLHVRHRRGHRDFVADRGDGHRLRPGRRRRATDRPACPRSPVRTRVSSPTSSATNRSRRTGNDLPTLALNTPDMALVDLFGDGLPDVLHSGPAGFRYWRNLGHGTLDRPRTLPQIPAGISLDQPGVGFGDMAGNGVADLLVNIGPLAGFFETTLDGCLAEVHPVRDVSRIRSAGPSRQDGRSDRRRPIRRADDPRRGVPVVCLSGRAGLRAAAVDRPQPRPRTSSRTCSSTIRPDGSAWPT